MTADSDRVLGLGLCALARLLPLSLVVDNAGRIEAAGPTLRRIAGDIEGLDFFDVFAVRRPRRVHRLKDFTKVPQLSLQLRMPDGDETAFRAVAVPLPSESAGVLMNLSLGIEIADAVNRFGLTLSDFAATDLAVEMLYLIEAKHAATSETRDLIGRLEHARSDAEARSKTDALTGLPNRRGFEQHVRGLTELGAPFAVMAIDLDHFKNVNDVHGHVIGDAVLKAAAVRFSETLRSADFLARTGGDEFLAILLETEESRVLCTAGQRLIAALQEPIMVDGVAYQIGASVGIATTDGTRAEEAGALIDRADVALYDSKKAGRGVVTRRTASAD